MKCTFEHTLWGKCVLEENHSGCHLCVAPHDEYCDRDVSFFIVDLQGEYYSQVGYDDLMPILERSKIAETQVPVDVNRIPELKRRDK